MGNNFLECKLCKSNVLFFMPLYYQHLLTQMFFDMPAWPNMTFNGNPVPT